MCNYDGTLNEFGQVLCVLVCGNIPEYKLYSLELPQFLCLRLKFQHKAFHRTNHAKITQKLDINFVHNNTSQVSQNLWIPSALYDSY